MPIAITDAALERVLEVRAREHEPEGLALWVEIVGVAVPPTSTTCHSCATMRSTRPTWW
jgi:hypothetical protein